jgi:transcriptional regulator with XRE-family HTH domain
VTLCGMDRRSEIAGFLRSRRARVTPEEAGLPADGRARRVPGLRRDEVARLAGMSTEYYTRLEQGRAGIPSPEVVEAIARTLQLDLGEREHLTNLLAGPASARREPPAPPRVRPGLHVMLQTLEHVPAFIIDRRLDVLASNHLARAVLTDFEALPVPQRNLARFYLLDPGARDRVIDWPTVAEAAVGMLRLSAGHDPNDRRLTDLVGEFTRRSPEFAAWWSEHRVLRRTYGTKSYRHPDVGDLHFSYECLHPPGDPDQTLVVYNVEPGSPTAEALRLLGSLTTPARHVPAPPSAEAH